MNLDFFINFFYESIRVFLYVSGPLLLSSLLIGFIISFFQAITQIHEQTLSFIPKILAIFFTLFYFGPWMLHNILNYMYFVFNNIPVIISN
ncbi:flagellar biosynthesis protein FliQ [Buchnera aphidicola]|uniref:flagellar biosynthesis protein FliQ n=1 Tax=Buchnera aphidicola TaxID=9 RepID=UPI0031B880B6